MKMQSVALVKKVAHGMCFNLLFILLAHSSFCQSLTIGDSGYFEKLGVTVFEFNGRYNGMFYDEKTTGIELIHHGVRTATGGAIRLQNTPEQWDLIPILVNRKVDKAANTIEATLLYKEYDFTSKPHALFVNFQRVPKW